jgi:hypothetical protein
MGTEGQEVRQAFDGGPDIEHDQLIDKANRHNREDAERAVSAAETRSDIGHFLEDTGLNKSAYSWLRRIKKVGETSQDKAMDIIRSLKAGLPMVDADIAGQSTPDMFDGGTVGDDEPSEQPDRELSPEEEEFNAAVDDNVQEVDFNRAAE